MAKTKFLIVDDHAIYRTGLRCVLENAPGFDAEVFEASSGEEGLELASAKTPDVAIVDLSMPGGIDGEETVVRLKRLLPSVKTIVISAFPGADAMRRLAGAANGLLAKSDDAGELVSALLKVLQGGKFFSEEIDTGNGKFAPEELTVRERQVLDAMAKGSSNREICAELGLKLPTVKSYVHAIMEKLGTSSRSETVAMAHKKLLV